MSIDKFRLNWRSNPQAQYDELQKMVMHLTNIAISLDAINVKLNILPQLITEMNNQRLLLQSISDNTACACNGISQVNDNLVSIQQDLNVKLDAIISGLPGPVDSVPVYKFELDITSVDITQDILEVGSIVLAGISSKDGELFDQLTLVEEYDFIDDIIVLSLTQIEISFAEDAVIPEGTLPIQLRQAESGIVQQFNIYYEAPVSVDSYVLLDTGVRVPLSSQADVSALCTTGSSDSVITVGSSSFSKKSVKEVVLLDESLLASGKSIPNNFCYSFSSLVSLVLPDATLLIGSSFMRSCTSYNSQLVLPSGLVSIGNSFMDSCTAFAQSLELPSTLVSVGNLFMAYCSSFTGPLKLGSVLASAFSVSPSANSCLSLLSTSDFAYQRGVAVLGDDAESFRLRFPNNASFSFRNLLPSGIRFMSNDLEFGAAGGSQSVKMTSLLPWSYVRYTDDQGITHESELPDWLQLDVQSGDFGTFNLTFTVSSNAGSSPRYASLDFEDGNVSSNLIVEQSALSLSEVVLTRAGATTDDIVVALFTSNNVPTGSVSLYTSYHLPVDNPVSIDYDPASGFPAQDSDGITDEVFDGGDVYVYYHNAGGSGNWDYAGYFTLDPVNGNVFEVFVP